jgi:hypothetical protein
MCVNRRPHNTLVLVSAECPARSEQAAAYVGSWQGGLLARILQCPRRPEPQPRRRGKWPPRMPRQVRDTAGPGRIKQR